MHPHSIRHIVSVHARTWLCGFGLALLPAMTLAAPRGWVALAPEELANLRGTYAPVQGMQLTLGVEQLATLNGQLVARTELMLLNGETGTSLPPSLTSSMTLVQNGAGNIADPALGAGTAAMVIQNSLSDQAIGSQTIINASVNSRSLMQTIDFQAQLSESLARAAAVR